jgi:hypothetical protein
MEETVMNPDFGPILADWSEFFSAVAGISATLVGLLFVALGLNPHIMADDGPTGLRVWSGQTFHSFLVLLVLGLAGLVPSDAGQTLAISLAILGLQGVVRVVVDASRVRRARREVLGTWGAWTRFITPGLAYLIMLWTARGVWMEDASSLSWLVAIVFMLMIGSLASCWDLLKAVGSLSRGGDATAQRT